MEDLETTIMELLVNAGAARSAALTALQMARKGEFDEAEKAMEESREYVKHAHTIQTQLIGLDEGTGKLPVNLITVHSQDHLMNAMVIQDLAGDMIELYRRILKKCRYKKTRRGGFFICGINDYSLSEPPRPAFSSSARLADASSAVTCGAAGSSPAARRRIRSWWYA